MIETINFSKRRKSSKFQNFKYFYDNNINIIQNYDRFFILDDDIRFGVDDINNMFNISRQFYLDICAPSFSEGTASTFISFGLTSVSESVACSVLSIYIIYIYFLDAISLLKSDFDNL